ncbi:flavin monoamine oxidase family protein [Ekhidna sp.]
MKESKKEITIIGAGLTGLTLAYILKKENYSIRIIEAREEIGGRILSVRKENLAPLEMGATWFGHKHTQINEILADLGINSFEQRLGENAIYEPLSTSPPQLVKLPPNGDESSFRIKDGSISLIQCLANHLQSACEIFTSKKVISIEKSTDGICVKTENDEFKSDVVVSTLPPYLLLKTVSFSPALHPKVREVMRETHTWMGESIKVGLNYKKPFWRKANLSGTIFSNVGPIPEMYDHANFEDSHFALKGFLNGAYFALKKEERLGLILTQLRKYFGNQADDFIWYEEKVWRNDPLTFSPYESDILPHQNNGHPVFAQPLLDNTFFIAGSETASQFPGYMEGAIRSAQYVAASIKGMSK